MPERNLHLAQGPSPDVSARQIVAQLRRCDFRGTFGGMHTEDTALSNSSSAIAPVHPRTALARFIHTGCGASPRDRDCRPVDSFSACQATERNEGVGRDASDPLRDARFKPPSIPLAVLACARSHDGRTSPLPADQKAGQVGRNSSRQNVAQLLLRDFQAMFGGMNTEHDTAIHAARSSAAVTLAIALELAIDKEPGQSSCDGDAPPCGRYQCASARESSRQNVAYLLPRDFQVTFGGMNTENHTAITSMPLPKRAPANQYVECRHG